jgi:acetyl-CoA acyltransferase 1
MAAFNKVARNVLQKSPNDVVLLSAVRSPISRSFKGGYKDARPEDILMPVRTLDYWIVATELIKNRS